MSSISTPQSSSAATNPTTVSADIIRVAFGLSIETDPSVTLNVKPTPAGAMTIASSTVTTGTSSPSGYTLYLQMTGENSTTNSLINSVDANATLTSSGSFTNPTTLSSGTWGYAIPSGSTSLLNTNGFDDSYTEVESVAQTGSKFAAIPTTNSPAEKIAETYSPSVVELPVYYAAMASYDTISGTYSNKVLYTALADDGATPTMVVAPDRIAGSGNIPLTLVTSLYTTNENFSYSAYMLTPDQYAAVQAGTLDVSTLTSQKLASCSRDTSFDAFALNCRSVSLDHAGPTIIYLDIPAYDVHYNDQIMLAGTEDFYTISTMQEMTPAVCASVPTPAANADYAPTTYLTDSRDNKVYEVKKLADGNCWMTQNLAISGTAIDYTNSNLPAGASYTVPESSTDGWCTETTEACINSANVLDAGNEDHPEYGTYYSWKAATAGYGTYSTTSGNVSYSVCPKGWRLPTGGANGAFQGLYNKYDSTSAMLSEAGPNFVLSGFRNGTITNGQNTNGSYMSSTAYNSDRVYVLGMSSSTMWPVGHDNRFRGLSIRCIADSFWNISDMQEMTSDTCAVANTPAATATNIDTDGTHADDDSYVPQRTLYDIRDGNSYRIRKLADGNCWMTENLRLSWSSSRTLTNADTNINTTNSKTIDVATQATSTNGVPSTTEINAWKEGATAGGNWNRYLSRSNGSHTETNPSQSGAAATNLTGENQLIGTYYNWYTSTLGSLNSTTETPNIGVNAPDDICPKGWQLPRYSAVNGTSTTAQNKSWMYLIRDIYKIITTQGDQSTLPDGKTDANTKLHAFPFSLPYSGRVARDSGATVTQATHGHFWSAAPSSATSSRYLYFRGTSVLPEDSMTRTYGLSVRCVSK